MKLRSCLLALALAWTLAAQQKLAFTDVQSLITFVKNGVRTEPQAVSLIKTRGVDFAANEDNLGALRKFGASEAILDAIRSTAPPPPRPPDPPPVPKGTLSVRCDPAECDIRINGQLLGPTSHSQLARGGLNLGEVEVEFEKDGYLGQQKIVKITAEPGPEIAVVLEPTEATKAANGKRLFIAM